MKQLNAVILCLFISFVPSFILICVYEFSHIVKHEEENFEVRALRELRKINEKLDTMNKISERNLIK